MMRVTHTHTYFLHTDAQRDLLLPAVNSAVFINYTVKHLESLYELISMFEQCLDS